MHIRSVVVFLSFLCLAGDVGGAEDWKCDRFTLSLRHYGKSPLAGKAFLTHRDESRSYCMRGSYFVNTSTKPTQISLTFHEAWSGSLDYDRYWWNFDRRKSPLSDPCQMSLEWLQNGNRLVLTHLPESNTLLKNEDRDSNWNPLEWGSGETVEFTKSYAPLFRDSDMPPSMNSLLAHRNRYKDNPKSTWGLSLLTQTELMFVTSGPDRKIHGFGALQLDASKEDPWKGAAWLVHDDIASDRGILAGRGTFVVGGAPGDSQAKVLQLSFPRVFEYQGGGGVSAWRTKQSTESGMTFKIPLTDSGFRERMPGYVNELFFIDSDGGRERRYVKEGFLNLSKREYHAFGCVDFDLLDSVEFRPVSELAVHRSASAAELQRVITSSPPPGFRLKSLTPAMLQFREAETLAKSGNKLGATKLYRIALGSSPNDPKQIRAYSALLPENDLRNKLWVYKQLARVQSTQPRTVATYAHYLRLTGSLSDALSIANQAIAIASGNEKLICRKAKAEVLADMGRHKEAFNELMPYVRSKPTDLSAFNDLAWNFAENANSTWDRSQVTHFPKYVTKDRAKENYFIYLDTLAGVYSKFGMHSEAASTQSRVILHAPDSWRDEAKLRLEIYRAKKDLTQTKGYQWWTDSSGKHAIAGKLIKFDGKNITLQKLNDRTTSLPIAKLSSLSRKQAQQSRVRVAKPAVSN